MGNCYIQHELCEISALLWALDLKKYVDHLKQTEVEQQENMSYEEILEGMKFYENKRMKFSVSENSLKKVCSLSHLSVVTLGKAQNKSLHPWISAAVQ